MAKFEVLEVFRDKSTKDRYEFGDIYKTDDLDRAEFLQRKGYLGMKLEEMEADTEEPETVLEPEIPAEAPVLLEPTEINEESAHLEPGIQPSEAAEKKSGKKK